jgi:tetratricopeptide (TPR) repeat protein
MGEIFRLQSDLAEQVAQALDITILEPVRKALDSRPTENMEAYEYYLRGFKYLIREMQFENDIKIAIRMFERAVELDPNFALAFTRLCIIHLHMYKLYYDKTDERFAIAKQALDKAVELAPDLLETQLALGHYYTQLDLDRALEQFEIIRKMQPNHPDALSMTAYIYRSQGNFEQSISYFNKLLEIHPRSCLTLTHTGFTLSCMRRYQEAESYFNRAILEHPDQAMPYLAKAWNYVRWESDTEKAKAVLAEALQNFDSTENPFVNSFIELEVLDRNYSKALDWLSEKSEDTNDIQELFFIYRQYAQIYGYMGKNEPSRKYYDKARSILESKMGEMPKDERLHGWLGIVYAGLGCKEDAIRQGKLAVETAPVNNHAIIYPFRIEELARIYVMVGLHDQAIEKLEHLMYIPNPFSIHSLRLDPAWDPLRNHPRFKKLIETYNQ